ncbi:MAG: ATP-binding protein [Vicinamibacteraceae bacterium]
MSPDESRRSLSEADDRLRLLDENVRDYAIFMADADGILRTWNVGVERLLGYREEEFVGQPLAMIFTPEDVASGAASAEIQTALASGRAEDERWHVRKDGSRFWAMGVLTCLREPDGLVRGFAKIMRDTTERKLAEEERKVLLDREATARREAEIANRVRDQFLAAVSHELRTPLNAVLGWARLLLQQDLGAERTKAGLETIARNAQLQAALVDDLLDVSRMLAGNFVIQRRPTDLMGVVQASVDSISPGARAKDIAIECRLHPLEAPVVGDSRRLHQILWNLLSNAVKFTMPGGRILIELHQDADGVALSVTDDGQGIAADFLPFVFDPFRQADMSGKRTHAGLGLGLAIVRQLVSQHGGTITAQSDGPGKGATFKVVLPLTTPDPDEPGRDRLGPSLAGIAVLVIEDDVDSRDVLVNVLELAGASVTAVGSAPAALASLSEFIPSVVLCDIGLPGTDGLSFVESLRALPAERGGCVPAAALTAYAGPADRLQALQAGFQMHLAKPLEPSDVVAAVATLAGQRPEAGA